MGMLTTSRLSILIVIQSEIDTSIQSRLSRSQHRHDQVLAAGSIVDGH